MNMEPFRWVGDGADGNVCYWLDMTLVAFDDGRWEVYEQGKEIPFVSWRQQTIGTNTEDAIRRAQSAAMNIQNPTK